MANYILRLPEVKKRTGLARSTIYLRMNQGNFPKQLKLGSRTSGWIESEVEQWVANQIEQRKS